MGKKAVRIDILERLADFIRPALSWKEDQQGEKPKGAYNGRQFYVTADMLSILGATHEDMEQVLKSLGYRSQKHLESDIIPPVAPLDEKKAVEREAEAVAAKEDPVKSDEPVEEKADAEPEEPKSILLWQRDFKPKREQNNRPRPKGKSEA